MLYKLDLLFGVLCTSCLQTQRRLNTKDCTAVWCETLLKNFLYNKHCVPPFLWYNQYLQRGVKPHISDILLPSLAFVSPHINTLQLHPLSTIITAYNRTKTALYAFAIVCVHLFRPQSETQLLLCSHRLKELTLGPSKKQRALKGLKLTWAWIRLLFTFCCSGL